MGGALGIAGLTALELGYYYHQLEAGLLDRGFRPTAAQIDKVREFILEAERADLQPPLAVDLRHVGSSPGITKHPPADTA